MRKPTFCICENKDADQLRGNREADQRLCFRYTDSTIPLLAKPLAISSGCAAWFVSDLVRIHIVGFLMLRLIYGLHREKTCLRGFQQEENSFGFRYVSINVSNFLMMRRRGRVVKVADFIIALDHRSSHRCDWCGFEPHTGHK